MGQKVPKRLSWSEGCLLGVQGPQLAVLGELQGLPKAADLWDELGPLKHLHPPLSRVRGYMEYLAEPLSPQAQVAYHPPWGAQAPAQGWPWAPPAGRAGAGGLRVCVPASVLRESSLCWFVYPSAEAAASVPSRRALPGGACGCAASPVSCHPPCCSAPLPLQQNKLEFTGACLPKIVPLPPGGNTASQLPKNRAERDSWFWCFLRVGTPQNPWVTSPTSEWDSPELPHVPSAVSTSTPCFQHHPLGALSSIHSQHQPQHQAGAQFQLGGWCWLGASVPPGRL